MRGDRFKTTLPRPMASAVRACAQTDGRPSSAVIEDFIARGLEERGLWPPLTPEPAPRMTPR